MSQLSIATIEGRAEALIAGMKTPPVPINAIAKSLGLTLEPAALGDDVSGVLVINDGTGVIGFNKDHPFVRQRFTIAHEIGHFLLHKDQESLFIDKSYQAFYRSSKSANSADRRERDANAFAAALLMPAALVRRAIRDLHFDLGDDAGALEELARMFQVSTQAMSFRLANIGALGPSNS